MAGKNAFGTVRTLASGKFQARYLADGKQVSAGTFKTAREAWKALAAIQTDLDRGEHVVAAADRVTFAEHADAVLEHRKGDLRDSTLRNYRQFLRVQLNPTFGRMALVDITVQDVDRWWSRWADKPGARKNSYMVGSMVFRYAIRWQLVKTSPFMVEKAGADPSKKRPTFSVEDFRAVVAHAPLELGAAFWVLFGAHLRVAEVAGLNLGDYDPATKTLNVVRQYASNGPRALTPTKTGNHKKVRLLAPAVAALEAHLAETTGKPWDPMFRGVSGARMAPRIIQDAFAKARTAAGHPQMHVHDARYIGLTLVAQSGVASLRDVMTRAGHTTVQASVRYLHTSQAQDAKVAAATDALL